MASKEESGPGLVGNTFAVIVGLVSATPLILGLMFGLLLVVKVIKFFWFAG